MTEPSNLMQAMYWSCADALTLAARIPSSPDLPDPAELRNRIGALLNEMATKGAQAGLSRDDLEDARYAIVAFLDEQILASNWSGKQDWMLEPLQLAYFNENTAGEGFFKRMQALEARPERAHVLQLYYLCVSLGFQGIYAVIGAQALGAVHEQVGTRLMRSLPAVDAISPNGVPPDVGRRRKGRQLPVITAAVALLLVSIIVFVTLRLVLSSSASNAASVMNGAATRTAGHQTSTQGR